MDPDAVLPRSTVQTFNDLCCEIRAKLEDGRLLERALIHQFIDYVLSDSLTSYELFRSDFTATFEAIFASKNQSVLKHLESSGRRNIDLVVRKLVTIFETVEQFGSNLMKLSPSHALRIVHTTINMKAEIKGEHGDLLDKTGEHVRMELLATVGELRKFIKKQVSKEKAVNNPAAQEQAQALVPAAPEGVGVEMDFGFDYDEDGEDGDSEMGSEITDEEDLSFEDEEHEDEAHMEMEVEDLVDDEEEQVEGEPDPPEVPVAPTQGRGRHRMIQVRTPRHLNMVDFDDLVDDEEEDEGGPDHPGVPPAQRHQRMLQIRTAQGRRLLESLRSGFFEFSMRAGEARPALVNLDHESLLEMLMLRSAVDFDFGRRASWSVVRRDYEDMVTLHDSRSGVQTATSCVEEITLTDIAKANTSSQKDQARAASTDSNADTHVHLALKISKRGGLGDSRDAFVRLDDDSSILYYVLRKALCKEDEEKPYNAYAQEYSYTLLYSSSPLNTLPVTKPSPWSSARHTHSSVKEVLNALSSGYSVLGISTAFTSHRLTSKLKIALSNPLSIVAGSLPSWCDRLIYQYPFLFSLEARLTHMRATSFGSSRAVTYLQQLSPSTSSVLGTSMVLKMERFIVPRLTDMLSCAFEVFGYHAQRKTALSIQFIDEEGTGVGPTREFYGILADNFQRSDLALWFCDEGSNSVYVRNPGGLFPAPIPSNHDANCKYFRLLGTIMATALQDAHLVDLPLSLPFFKILVNGGRCDPGLLSLDDMHIFYPTLADILKQIEQMVASGGKMMQSAGFQYRVEDMNLVFTVNAPSKHFSYESIDLIPNGSQIGLTTNNVQLYLKACKSLYLCDGIKAQMEAFSEGFSLVFPIETLRRFTATELRHLLCGDKNLEWTRDDLIKSTEVSHGYTKETPVFLHLIDVLLAMTAKEKRDFLQFATGCPTLPPGGFASLKPPLTVVKRVDCGDGSYPSVNTCMHFLKLPEYSSAQVLRRRLLTALKVHGFQMN